MYKSFSSLTAKEVNYVVIKKVECGTVNWFGHVMDMNRDDFRTESKEWVLEKDQ